jgi:hypothetical protein
LKAVANASPRKKQHVHNLNLTAAELALLVKQGGAPTAGTSGEPPMPGAASAQVGHNGGPLLEPDDVLLGGLEIHAYVCGLLRVEQSLSATYWQLKRGQIPAMRLGAHLVSSKRAIAQRFGREVGLAA